MKRWKIAGFVCCLFLMLALYTLPALANIDTIEGIHKLINSFSGVIDILNNQDYNFQSLIVDTIDFKQGFEQLYPFDAGDTNIIAAKSPDIAKMHIQIVNSKDKVIAEITDKSPMLQFTVPKNGSYRIIINAETFEPGVKKDETSYIGFVLGWK